MAFALNILFLFCRQTYFSKTMPSWNNLTTKALFATNRRFWRPLQKRIVWSGLETRVSWVARAFHETANSIGAPRFTTEVRISSTFRQAVFSKGTQNSIKQAAKSSSEDHAFSSASVIRASRASWLSDKYLCSFPQYPDSDFRSGVIFTVLSLPRRGYHRFLANHCSVFFRSRL
jgi:hypothetical protein